MKTSLAKSAGFTLFEILVTMALVSTFVFLALAYSRTINQNASLVRKSSTKNRVLSGIRDLAGMPAALRVSMRAAEGGNAVNPQLLACAGGNPINSCQSGVEFPFTLYSPLLERNAARAIMGVQPVSSPLGNNTAMRLDSFGAPCSVAGPDCPLLVFTSFKAQCGPPPQPTAPPTPVTLQFVPQALCTVADVIEVTFYVQLDPNIIASDPTLAVLSSVASGSVVVPVVAISGNLPQ